MCAKLCENQRKTVWVGWVVIWQKFDDTQSDRHINHRYYKLCRLHQLHWLPIQHRTEYKVAVLTITSRSSATALTYLSRHIKARVSEWTLRSSRVPLLDKPFTSTDFARRAFRCSVPTVWNSLHETIISADLLSVFKSRLKTYFFRKAFD